MITLHRIAHLDFSKIKFHMFHKHCVFTTEKLAHQSWEKFSEALSWLTEKLSLV